MDEKITCSTFLIFHIIYLVFQPYVSNDVFGFIYIYYILYYIIYYILYYIYIYTYIILYYIKLILYLAVLVGKTQSNMSAPRATQTTRSIFRKKRNHHLTFIHIYNLTLYLPVCWP